jgi:hypothetical protein
MGGVEDDAKFRTAFSKSAQESDRVCSAGETDREAESRAEKRRLDGQCCAHERMIEHLNDPDRSLVTAQARNQDKDLSAETPFNSRRLEDCAVLGIGSSRRQRKSSTNQHFLYWQDVEHTPGHCF